MTREHLTMNLPPTHFQQKAITHLIEELGDLANITHQPRNRWEARDLIFKLRQQRKKNNVQAGGTKTSGAGEVRPSIGATTHPPEPGADSLHTWR